MYCRCAIKNLYKFEKIYIIYSFNKIFVKKLKYLLFFNKSVKADLLIFRKDGQNFTAMSLQ